MKKVWNKLSELSQYYLISLINLVVTSGILTLLSLDFINIVFFMTAFVWHFALLTPGLRETVLLKSHRLSFLSVVIRSNHYLQLFINIKKFPYSSSLVRAISPCVFTFLLFVFGGTGNILFTLLGSFCFEFVYILTKPYIKSSSPLVNTVSRETPPAIPSEGKIHE
jgi:hypothetical protein